MGDSPNRPSSGAGITSHDTSDTRDPAEVRVRALHAEVDTGQSKYAFTRREEDKAVTTACRECDVWYPCRTIQALEGTA